MNSVVSGVFLSGTNVWNHGSPQILLKNLFEICFVFNLYITVVTVLIVSILLVRVIYTW